MSQIRGLGGIVGSSKSADIQDVPSEILDHVFEKYVTMGQSPWDLTLVSRLWRMISLANPNLWRYIHIGELAAFQKPPYTKWRIKGSSLSAISYGNRQVCSSAVDLTHAIRRTGLTTLNVTIGPLASGLENLVKRLFINPISSRIIRLEFIDDHRFNQALMKDEIGPFSALEQFFLPEGTNMDRVLPLVQSIQRTAFQLREFDLGSQLLGKLLEINSELKPEMMKPLFGRLHYLTMVGNGAREVDTYVRYCSHLVGLTCDFPEWPNESATVDLPRNIQILSLNCAPRNLHYLHLSSLRELTLDDSTNPDVSFLGSNSQIGSELLDLPSLVTLRAASRSLDWLMHLQAPRLRELFLQIRQECICNNPRSQMQLSYSTCIWKLSIWSMSPLLSKLSLTASCIEENFMVILEALTNIQSLTLIRRRSRNETQSDFGVLDRLTEILVTGGLSQLEVFIFGDEVWPIYRPKETVDSQVRHILELQKQKGQEMLRFDVYWSDGTTFSAKKKLSYVNW